MAVLPFMPLWTDAYLGDTSHLTTIEHGAYFLLLMAAWRSKEGYLPDNDEQLRKYAKLSKGQWKRYAPTLRAFFISSNGVLIQRRLSEERDTVFRRSKKASDNANARWLKEKEMLNAIAKDSICETDASISRTIATELSKDNSSPSLKVTSVLKAKYQLPDGTSLGFEDLFERFWTNYPTTRDKGDKPSARFALIKQLTKGINYETIGRGITRYKNYCSATNEKNADFSRWITESGWSRPYDIPSLQKSRPGEHNRYSLQAVAAQALADKTHGEPEGRAERLKALGVDDD